MRKFAAAALLVATITGASATAAFAKNGADDGTTGRVDCRHHDTICVTQ